MPIVMLIVGVLLLVANLVFMFHWIATGSLMVIVSIIGAVAAASIIFNASKGL